MSDEEKYNLLMKEDKSTLARALVSLGKDIIELNRRLDSIIITNKNDALCEDSEVKKK